MELYVSLVRIYLVFIRIYCNLFFFFYCRKEEGKIVIDLVVGKFQVLKVLINFFKFYYEIDYIVGIQLGGLSQQIMEDMGCKL